MPKCSGCGRLIFFGGVRGAGRRYCDSTCATKELLHLAAEKLPKELIAESVRSVHAGDCPTCGARGPVDIHVSYSVVSLLIVTRWNSIPQLCCRRCGFKAQVKRLMVSTTFGWWSFPWGILITPFQIIRNIVGIVCPPDPSTPSQELIDRIRLRMATEVVTSPRPGNESTQNYSPDATLVVCINPQFTGQRVSIDATERTVTFENCHQSRRFTAVGFESVRVCRFDEILAVHDCNSIEHEDCHLLDRIVFALVHMLQGDGDLGSLFISTATGRSRVFTNWNGFDAFRTTLRQIPTTSQKGYWEDDPRLITLFVVILFTVVIGLVFVMI